MVGGVIHMLDEGTRRRWRVDVAPFLLGETPVTRALYAAVTGRRAPGDDVDLRPQTDVSWVDCARFCNALSRRHGFDPCYDDDALAAVAVNDVDVAGVAADVARSGFRLPTEAEWEFACRAGSDEPRYGDLDAIAWHRGNSGEQLQPVRTRAPNAWGFFDLIGNVWEWCEDRFDEERYRTYRVFRGGGFVDLPHACRASCRRKSHPRYAAEDIGFRVARAVPKGSAG